MKKPKLKKPAPPPTPEQRLLALRDERSNLAGLVTQRRRLGAFDANSDAIISALEATLDVIDYLISLNEQDRKRAEKRRS